MTPAMRAVLAAAVCAAWVSTARASAPDVPYLTGRVVDEANILSADARARLGAALKAHEDHTTNQIVVLTIPTLDGDSVESYAVRVFSVWKLGQKGKDNGVLLLIVPQDRKLRIEVGYGLEPTLPDGACGEIIRTWITPAFKQGHYDRGVEDGVAAIVARLEGRGEPAGRRPAPAPSSAAARPQNAIRAPVLEWPMRILMGAFIFGIIGLFTVVSVMTPGVGWFMYVFLIPFWAMFPVFIIGPHATLFVLAAYVVGYPIVKMRLRRLPWYVKAAADLKAKGVANIGGFTVSSGWSGGSSGGGFSGGGGGFSGGGGSSGGGGASGSW